MLDNKKKANALPTCSKCHGYYGTMLGKGNKARCSKCGTPLNFQKKKEIVTK